MGAIRSVFWACCLVAGAACAETMRVQVQSGQVRGTPSFLGGVVATLAYGQPVEAAAAQGGAWYQVRTPDGKSGWMHASALTVKRVAAPAGSGAARTGASGDEMALAGKGFNSDVEAQFKAHSQLDFTWVDKMATMKASTAEIAQFVERGALAQPGGAK